MRRDANVLDRRAGDAANQGFNIRVFELAEGRMRPTNDAGFGHGRLLSREVWRQFSAQRR